MPAPDNLTCLRSGFSWTGSSTRCAQRCRNTCGTTFSRGLMRRPARHMLLTSTISTTMTTMTRIRSFPSMSQSSTTTSTTATPPGRTEIHRQRECFHCVLCELQLRSPGLMAHQPDAHEWPGSRSGPAPTDDDDEQQVAISSEDQRRRAELAAELGWYPAGLDDKCVARHRADAARKNTDRDPAMKWAHLTEVR